MSLNLRQLADLVGGTLHGDGELEIRGATIVRDAQPGEITLADGEKALKQLATSQASAVVVNKQVAPPQLPHIVVENVPTAFAKIVAQFRPLRSKRRMGIHTAAHVSPLAKFATNVDIHAGATIGDHVEIGANSTIHSGVVIAAGCRIGQNVTIFPNAVLYEDTIVGDDCMIHAAAVLGAFGFGYTVVNGRHELSAQLGWVELGPRVEIGAGATIDRGTYGATYIGEGTKLDNQVQIAHNVRLGKHNLICAQVGIAGSSSTGDYVVMAGQVGVRDHVHVATGVQLGAKAGVINDIHEAGQYIGQPAMPEREHFACLFGFARLPEMRKQFKQLQRDVDALKGDDESETARKVA